MKPMSFTIGMLLGAVLMFGSAEARDLSAIDFADLDAVLAERNVPQLDFFLYADAAFDERRDSLELAFTTGVADALELSLTHRAAIGGERLAGVGTELRIGRGMLDAHEPGVRNANAYAFVAANNDAVTWRPCARSDFGGRGNALALQDRVEVGDLAAGVTYERSGVQASLAYVERQESARLGRGSFSREQRFAGVTVTMRH
jgi:hypothetical protein